MIPVNYLSCDWNSFKVFGSYKNLLFLKSPCLGSIFKSINCSNFWYKTVVKQRKFENLVQTC